MPLSIDLRGDRTAIFTLPNGDLIQIRLSNKNKKRLVINAPEYVKIKWVAGDFLGSGNDNEESEFNGDPDSFHENEEDS